MKIDWRRLIVGGSAVCLASWLALAATAGNVGLQRSISKGGISLFELPTVIVLVAVVAAAAGFVAARQLRLSAPKLVAAVLVGDLFAGLVLAPFAIGELEPIHAPLVVAAVSVMGLQPAAAFVGAWAGRKAARDIPLARGGRSVPGSDDV
ncbi:MAG: hypothetical protein EPO36_11240 [Chloroflexota bacterium]|nr:MAG: hypothetical protein EPO36_11240 [Chloroflexota bacterium]